MQYLERPNMRTQHHTKVEQVVREALDIAAAANLIATKAKQVLDHGGRLDIQSQVNFITGSYARMMKDWGVVEQLQQLGSVVKRPAPVS